MIRANAQCVGGWFSLFNSMICQILMFSLSRRHFFHMFFIIDCRSRQSSMPLKFVCFDISNGGGSTNDSSTNKWPGFRACISAGSSVSGYNGRELSIASIWANNVNSCSYVRLFAPITLILWNFVDFTAASYMPPWWRSRWAEMPFGISHLRMSSCLFRIPIRVSCLYHSLCSDKCCTIFGEHFSHRPLRDMNLSL